MAKDIKVDLDDCISSIAFEHGFYWETIWNHANNAELKERRKDPNILEMDDVVHVPDLRIREVSKATEQTHKFKMKGLTRLKLRILEEPKPEDKAAPAGTPAPPQMNKDVETEDPEGEQKKVEDVPRANVPYTLRIGRKVLNGQTDGDGQINVVIPANASRGRLTIDPGSENEMRFQVRLGALRPITEVSGVKIRLRNLGFDCGDINDDETESFKAAIEAFQEKNGLEKTGTVNDETRAKIKDLHLS